MIAVPSSAQPAAAGDAATAAGGRSTSPACASGTATSSRWTTSTSTIGAGEFFTMLGPSGSGKTTLLRLIAGFERPDAGRIELGGARRDPGRRRTLRNVNTVFQDYALFPHMTVARERRVRPAGAAGPQARSGGERADRALEMVRLRRARRAQARPAVRRPAPARRAGPRHRERARGAAARRAARRARPQAPPGDAARAAARPARGRHHLRLRHARPGRGAHDERPHRGAEPAARSSRSATPIEVYERPADRVRRRVHRRLQPHRARRPPRSPSGRRRSRCSTATTRPGRARTSRPA